MLLKACMLSMLHSCASCLHRSLHYLAMANVAVCDQFEGPVTHMEKMGLCAVQCVHTQLYVLSVYYL